MNRRGYYRVYDERERERERDYPQRAVATPQTFKISLTHLLGYVALGMALAYFVMVLLDLDESDREKKKRTPPSLNGMSNTSLPPPVTPVTPLTAKTAVATRFGALSALDQNFVNAGTSLMQVLCPRASGFLMAALEDYDQHTKLQADPVEDELADLKVSEPGDEESTSKHI